jgi:hypothetical protein
MYYASAAANVFATDCLLWFLIFALCHVDKIKWRQACRFWFDFSHHSSHQWLRMVQEAEGSYRKITNGEGLDVRSQG